MIRLKEESKEFIWIDHHISKINELKDIKFDGLQVDGTAACVLTWIFFMKDNNPPISIRLIGDYDIWNLTQSVLCMQYGIRQYDCEPENQIFWKDVFENNLTKEIITKGETIYKYVTKTYKHEINSIGFITELCVELNEKLHTYNVLAVNRSHISSLFFEDHPEVNNVDIMIPFCWNGKSWKVSMYTMKDDIDVSKICYKFGGGGHKKAAGFTCDNLPVEISKALFK
jgi:oligoribonuclease NrnB/cAMP/cGMP phosphodiesterase (DHH superfamily)